MDIQQLRQKMKTVVYHSSDWHLLSLMVANRLFVEGKLDDALAQAEKVSVDKLPPEHKCSYHTVFAGIAEQKNELEKAVESYRSALAADRSLPKPSQQFSLSKQIAWNYDRCGLLDDAIAEWKRLIADLPNFEHSEHQPMLAYKFLSLTLIKAGRVEEAKLARRHWVEKQVSELTAKKQDFFKSKDPPESYNDELSNFFERSRQNVLNLWASAPALVAEFNMRNAQFWVGAESMRVKMADLQDAQTKKLTEKDQLPFFFYMRCISTYLTSVEMASSGRIPEAYGALRMCLENAFYAFHLAQDSSAAEIWLDRPTLALGEVDAGKVAKRINIGKVFSPGKIITAITAKSDQVGKQCRYFYEKSIDEGAHPNVDVFRLQASQRLDGSGYVFGLDFLSPDASVEVARDVLDVSEVILIVFRLAEWIW